ncbi:hypothetical protein AVEN_52556-1, partial [Araneus ventricosus]
GVSSKVLQEVEIHIVPLKQCNESYYKVARANFPQGITNVFICAGEKQGGKDACQVSEIGLSFQTALFLIPLHFPTGKGTSNMGMRSNSLSKHVLAFSVNAMVVWG